VSTPGQGNGGYRPGTPDGGGPGSYGGFGEPAKYPGGQQSPYGQQSSPYAYSPYGSTYKPAPAEDKPPPRPAILWLALTALLISAAPFMALGLLVLTQPIDATNIAPEQMAQLEREYGVTTQQVVDAIRSLGAVVGVIALVYVLLAAWAVIAGNNIVRIIVALLTTGFTLVIAAALVQLLLRAGDFSAAAVLGAILLASVAGTVIMFLPSTKPYFLRRSR
jgi:hypothetical protein